MPLILVGSQKGGVGKTTLGLNLAVARALAGYDVLLIDTDEQGSASSWSEIRNENGIVPVIPCVKKVGKIGVDLATIKRRHDTVIVDAGGKDSVEMRQAMVVCDRMVIPLRPSQFDLYSMSHMAQLITQIQEKADLKIDVLGVLNAVSANNQVTEAKDARELLAEFADTMPMAKTQVVDRVAFRRSVPAGRGILEGAASDQSHEKGRQEIIALYQEVFNERWKQAKNVAAPARAAA